MYGASNFLLAFLHFYFSILCADGLLFTPSLHKIVSELVGVNSNNSSVFGFLLVGENGVLERV